MHALLERLSAAFTTLTDSSWALYLIGAAAIAGGLLLWFRGGRTPRFTTACIGAMTLGSIGWTLAAILGNGSPGTHPWQGMLGGLALGAAVGWLARGYILTTACAGIGCVLGVGVAVAMIARTPDREANAPIVRVSSQTPERIDLQSAAASADGMDEAAVRELIAHVRANPGEAQAAAGQSGFKLTSILTEGGAAAALSAIGGGRKTDVTIHDGLMRDSLAEEGAATASTGYEPTQSDALATSEGHTGALAEASKRLAPAAAGVSRVWSSLSNSQRGTIAGAGAIGLAAGAILGACAGTIAAMVVSSLVGAGLLVVGSMFVLGTITTTSRFVQGRTPVEWAVVWGGVVALGLMVQGIGVVLARRRATRDNTSRE